MKPPHIDVKCCIACHLCETACSFALVGAFQPSRAAVSVENDREELPVVRITDTCACTTCPRDKNGQPLCVAFCPTEALSTG